MVCVARFETFFEGHRHDVMKKLNLSNGTIKKMRDKQILTDMQHADVQVRNIK